MHVRTAFGLSVTPLIGNNMGKALALDEICKWLRPVTKSFAFGMEKAAGLLFDILCGGTEVSRKHCTFGRLSFQQRMRY